MTLRDSTLLLSICLMACVLSGCTTVEFVELREKSPDPIMERLTRSTLGVPGPSDRTRRFLSASNYLGADDFVQMLRHCQQQLTTTNRLEAYHAAAEVSYLAARGARKSDAGLAMELFLDAARYSWGFATAPNSAGQLTDPNHAENRETTEIYNESLLSFLRLVKGSGKYRLGQSIRMPVSDRIVDLEIPHPSAWLTADQLGEFAFVNDYEVRNLRNRHTTNGLGVPIMVRRYRQQDSKPLEQYYSDGVSLPLTVVARFPPSNARKIRLQLLDPRETDGISVQNTLLPLESDLSTPLAWYLTNPKNSLLETFAFFRTDRAQELEGLQMLQPYDPQRIPVLMVHGIWSSPNTWMEMFNDLQSDPVLRDKYQFWFYMYPTGQPLTFAAASLRERLKELRLTCDPNGQNPKLDQMVVVGHSMGGLMAYLMTVDSEDKLWNALSNIPVENIQADPEAHSEIRRVFFFESDRSIDRIVTIASPFNGSGYSNFFTQWLGGSLVSLPNTTSRLSQLIFRQNNQSVWDRMFAPRTSLDSLNRDSAILKLVSETTVPPDVQHHNIVGVVKGKSEKDWTDGVVKLKSARRENAESEVRVKAKHSEVQRHPQTISEVRRVLHEHLKSTGQDSVPIVRQPRTRRGRWQRWAAGQRVTQNR